MKGNDSTVQSKTKIQKHTDKSCNKKHKNSKLKARQMYMMLLMLM